MRKIECKMQDAIRNNQYFKLSNTEVIPNNETIFVLFHDNKIAEINNEEKTLRCYSCGWHTTTTKSRLNAILSMFTTLQIKQISGVWYWFDNYGKGCEFMDGEPINIA